MYKYGVNLLLWTSTFTQKNLNLFPLVKNLGLDVVEIPLFNPEIVPAEKVKKELKKYDLEACGCYGCSPDADIASLDKNIRKRGIERFKNAVEKAHMIGAKKIGGVVYKAGGVFTGSAPTNEEWTFSVNSMREITQYAHQYDISICIEPVNRYETYFINTAQDAVKYCKDVDEPNISVLLDTHHLNIEESSFCDPIINTNHYLKHFHASENNRGTPGSGLVDWIQVYKALKHINYKGPIIIESFYLGFGNIWKKVAKSPKSLLSEGLIFLKNVEQEVFQG